MKITIEIEEAQDYGLLPSNVFKSLTDEHYRNLQKKYGRHFWGIGTACNRLTLELFAQIKDRKSNVSNLILTYKDAEDCFEIYKQVIDVWVKNFLEKSEG